MARRRFQTSASAPLRTIGGSSRLAPTFVESEIVQILAETGPARAGSGRSMP